MSVTNSPKNNEPTIMETYSLRTKDSQNYSSDFSTANNKSFLLK